MAELPWPRDTLEPDKVKLGAETVTAVVVLAVKLPEVPVIVRVEVPGLAELLAVRVSMLEPVVGLGLKDAVTPLGRPVTAKCTLPLNPLDEFTST